MRVLPKIGVRHEATAGREGSRDWVFFVSGMLITCKGLGFCQDFLNALPKDCRRNWVSLRHQGALKPIYTIILALSKW
jgi:hypothetical protein